MDELLNPLCLLRMTWRSFLAQSYVSGHKFVESDEETPANIQLLQCKTCGHYSFTWSWEDHK